MPGRDETDAPLDGDEPLEEVGPEGCQPKPKEVGQRPEDGPENAPQHSEFVPMDEISEQFPLVQIGVARDPTDGLPVPMDTQVALAIAPRFSMDSVVCLEDDREYVEMFESELKASLGSPGDLFRSDIAGRVLAGVYVSLDKAVFFDVRDAFETDGQSRARRRFPKSEVVSRWGFSLVDAHDGTFVPVRPARERCKFYQRQVFANDDVPDPRDYGHQIIFRNCTARRSVGGAFMSLRDEAVYACDYRTPHDPASIERYLDGPDRARLTAKIEQVPLFGLGTHEE